MSIPLSSFIVCVMNYTSVFYFVCVMSMPLSSIVMSIPLCSIVCPCMRPFVLMLQCLPALPAERPAAATSQWVPRRHAVCPLGPRAPCRRALDMASVPPSVWVAVCSTVLRYSARCCCRHGRPVLPERAAQGTEQRGRGLRCNGVRQRSSPRS